VKRCVFLFWFAIVALFAMAPFISQGALAQTTGVNTPPGSGQVLNLGTLGVPYMTIGTTGLIGIGIGTATPISTVEINNSTGIPPNTVTAGLTLNATYGAASSAQSIDFLINGNTSQSARIVNPTNGTDGELAFYTTLNFASAAPAAAMTILGSGNVGIGTTIPFSSARLHVHPSAINSNLYVRAGSDFGAGYSGVGLDSITDAQTARTMLVLSGTPTVFPSGNVGIGVTAPQAKLDVSGGIRAGSASTGGGCSPEGAMGYDFGAHQPVYCNGSAWASFSAAAAHIWEGDYIAAIPNFAGGLSQCNQSNPFTGGCSCPAGSSGTGGTSGNAFHNAPWDTGFWHVTCYK
jgi:hypothetical protein